MTKCLVVFASRYGSTKEVAQAVADGLGADIANVLDHPEIEPYDLVVLGSPIYSGTYLPAMQRFLRHNRAVLQEKKVAAFITAAADMQVQVGLTGDEDERLFTQQDFADGLAHLSGGHVIATRGFGGRLVVEKLDGPDRAALEWLYHYLMHKPLEGFDLLDPAAAYRWGEDLAVMVGA
jgi:menaquinone-dependent protoporphyrinogen oxidase